VAFLCAPQWRKFLTAKLKEWLLLISQQPVDLARLLQDALSKSLGVSIVVDNRAGGAGIPAAVRRAA
jgi:hypothetical protein